MTGLNPNLVGGWPGCLPSLFDQDQEVLQKHPLLVIREIGPVLRQELLLVTHDLAVASKRAAEDVDAFLVSSQPKTSRALKQPP